MAISTHKASCCDLSHTAAASRCSVLRPIASRSAGVIDRKVWAVRAMDQSVDAMCRGVNGDGAGSDCT